MSSAVVLMGLAVPVQAAPPPGTDKWALLVGVNRYQGRTRPTSGSVGDVEEVRTALIRAGWPADHIKVLTDGGATAGDIRSGLRWLVERSGDRSQSVFHYSGHTKQQGRTEFLWPHDNRFIADTELADQLRQLRGWAWVNIAACEAAGFDEGISSPRRLFTASSQANEKSYEMPPEYQNSVFSWLLVDQGMLQGAADRDRNGRVSVSEAFRYAAEGAPGITTGQRYGPQHPHIAGGEGREWFLEPPPPPPPPKPAERRCFIICLGR